MDPHILSRRALQTFTFVSATGVVLLILYVIYRIVTADEMMEIHYGTLTITFALLTVYLLVQILGLIGATKEHLKCIKLYLIFSLLMSLYMAIELRLGERSFGLILLWNLLGHMLTCFYIAKMGKVDQ